MIEQNLHGSVGFVVCLDVRYDRDHVSGMIFSHARDPSYAVQSLFWLE